METTYNVRTADLERQANALVYINCFDKICAKSKGRFRIVPLKGIDLIRSVYSDTLDRELKDIDLLVIPAERAMEFIRSLQADGYHPEFSFALDEAAMNTKRKVSMISPSERIPNVDVHIALVTKKFFSATINGFNSDSISRLKVVDEVVSELDDIDRWLYLSSHLAFHFLEGGKWYRDLILLMERYDDEDVSTLINRAKQYNFERVVAAVCTRIHPSEATGRVDITQLLPDKQGKRFLNYINSMAAHPERLGHGFRLARYYWEFIFISKKKQRIHSLLNLVFPALGNMQNIYRCHALPAILLYIPHILMNTLGLLLFSAQYHFISTFHKQPRHAE